MADLLQRAIDNNVGLYRTVLGRLGIALHVTADLAYTDEKAPPYYSNAVTRSACWQPDEAFHRIARIAETDRWADWSIKDSHDALDLAPHGLRRLFRATWIYLDPSRLEPPERALRFEVLRDEEGLCRWRRAWDADVELGRTVFGPELLRDPNLHFVAGYDGGLLACGCLFNSTDDVLGMSNFFTLGGERSCWAATIGYILHRLGACGVVGYARDGALADLQAVGFQTIGSLSVWHRPKV